MVSVRVQTLENNFNGIYPRHNSIFASQTQRNLHPMKRRSSGSDTSLRHVPLHRESLGGLPNPGDEVLRRRRLQPFTKQTRLIFNQTLTNLYSFEPI